MEEPCKESILFSTKNAVATLNATGYSISTVVSPWPLHGGSGGGLAAYEAALILHHGLPSTARNDTFSSDFTNNTTAPPPAIPELPSGLVLPLSTTPTTDEQSQHQRQLYGTFLLTAAAQGHNRLCEALLSAGAPASTSNASNWTAVHAAAACGNVPLFKTLLAHGGDVTEVTIRGCTVLHAAIRGAARRPDVNALAICTAIVFALADEEEKTDGVFSLADHVNAQDDDGKTALHLAVEAFNAIGHGGKNAELVSVVALLTSSPFFADPTIEDTNGCTPFTIAADKRAPSLCARLMSAPLDHDLFFSLCA